MKRLCTVLLSLFICSLGVSAAPPAGYYDSVDDSSAQALAASLHEIIDDHQRFPYTSTATDIWDIVNVADEDPLNPGNILDIYKNASYAKISGGTGAYNREHSWPKSYGFPNDNSSNYPYTDAHHLFASDASYNSSRSNNPYRNCDASCNEKVTLETNGRGGGSGFYPGNSNWARGTTGQETWQTWSGRQGDVARAMFYMAVRYDGGQHSITLVDEPDLMLTDDYALIKAYQTGSNEPIAYMGMLSDLLAWHEADPVDDIERRRNDVIFEYQGNRNPFIDNPEWVGCVFGTTCDGGGGGPGGGDPTVVLAATETLTGIGTVSGSLTATWSSDDNYQIIQETESGGKPNRRTSQAEHLWTFNVAASKQAQLSAEVAFDQALDDDSFTMEYRIGSGDYVTAFSIQPSAVDQMYTTTFNTGLGGTVTLRLIDADRTRGLRQLDAIRVDALRITYDDGGPVDTTPPEAPTGLVATAGNSQVSLDWNTNAETDLAGYVVYRAVDLAGPYDRITASTLTATGYTDTTVVNGTTYYYYVTAEDTSGNMSSPSASSSATPEGSSSGLLVVSSIDMSTSGNKTKKVIATVTMVDDAGVPVSGALVTGTFSGDASGTQQINTDSAGIARFQDGTRLKSPATVTFCVDSAEKSGLVLDELSLGCSTISF
jgi:endonuclease I